MVITGLNEESRYEGVWESDDIAPLLLTSTLDGGEWSASLPRRFIPVENPLVTILLGAVCPRIGLNIMEKRRISCSIPRSSSL
jgi:hypothetical protein